jgi:hypothetical protein
LFSFNKKDIKPITGKGMGQVYTKLFPPPPTDAQIASIQQERLKFYNDLKTFQTNVSNQLESHQISPDTSQQLNALVVAAQQWLRSNPDATSLQVTTQNDDLTAAAQPIYERELAKNRYLFALWRAQGMQDQYNNDIGDFKKRFDNLYKPPSSLITSLSKLLDEEFKWIKENPSETGLTYTQRIDSASLAIQSVLTAYPTFITELQRITPLFKTNSSPYWWLEKRQNAQNNINNEQISKTKFSYQRLAENSTIYAMQIFGTFLLIVLIIFGGSLASNMAISREWQYRVFFFIFGSNPLLTPIILAYTALQALKGKPIEYYALCPISTEPAKTRLGKILWWPFYYETDNNELDLIKKFLEAVEVTGEAVKGASKPAAFQ